MSIKRGHPSIFAPTSSRSRARGRGSGNPEPDAHPLRGDGGESGVIKFVSFDDRNGFATLAARVPVTLAIGGLATTDVGTTRGFCGDYYTGRTDADDVLLTYGYDGGDVIRGDPAAGPGEITVRRARLVAVENVTRPEMDMADAIERMPGGMAPPT